MKFKKWENEYKKKAEKVAFCCNTLRNCLYLQRKNVPYL